MARILYTESTRGMDDTEGVSVPIATVLCGVLDAVLAVDGGVFVEILLSGIIDAVELCVCDVTGDERDHELDQEFIPKWDALLK